jgi:hypothetical protein
MSTLAMYRLLRTVVGPVRAYRLTLARRVEK